MSQPTNAAPTAPSSGVAAGDVVAAPQAAFPLKLSAAALSSLPSTVTAPNYDRAKVTAGIVHLGTGNFFLSHLASYVHDLLQFDPRWGIVATSIRTDGTIKGLREQDGAYVLVVRQNGKRASHVLAPVVETMFGPDNPQALAARIADPSIKLVTITVSNKGYCLKQGGIDLENEEIPHDVANPEAPKSIYGYLAAALKLRRLHSPAAPLTVMSLDNVEHNSRSLKTAFLQYLEQVQPDLVSWVVDNVDFPVTLVDRITPEVTDGFRQQMRNELGFDSRVLVGTEAFRQLVVERGRFELPDWERVGVKMVDDCAPWWARKFYLLNAGHQVAAIPGQRLGATYVHEAAGRQSVGRLLARAHKEWLTCLTGDREELQRYCRSIRQRFADEALGDTIQRVAARATSKVSERLLSSVELGLNVHGRLLKVPVFVTAVWLFNLGREDEFGEVIHLHDADAEKLQHVHREVTGWVRALDAKEKRLSADKVRTALMEISTALKDARFARLAANRSLVRELGRCLVDIHRHGVEKAIDQLLAR